MYSTVLPAKMLPRAFLAGCCHEASLRYITDVYNTKCFILKAFTRYKSVHTSPIFVSTRNDLDKFGVLFVHEFMWYQWRKLKFVIIFDNRLTLFQPLCKLSCFTVDSCMRLDHTNDSIHAALISQAQVLTTLAVALDSTVSLFSYLFGVESRTLEPSLQVV